MKRLAIDFLAFMATAILTVYVVRAFGGSELLAGSLGAVLGIKVSEYFAPSNTNI